MGEEKHMEVKLDEEREKPDDVLPWDEAKAYRIRGYKDPVKLTLFLSRGAGAIMKDVEEFPGPESFLWRVRRKNMRKKEVKKLEEFTGIRGRKKDPSPVRVYDEEDGPPRLTRAELKWRRQHAEMTTGEATEKALNKWERKHYPAWYTFFHAKEWRTSPAVIRLRRALGLPVFPPEVAGQAREWAMTEAAKRATRDAAVCHPLCLFGLSASARALLDAEAHLAEQMGVASRDQCAGRADPTCSTRQRKQSTVAAEAAEREAKRRRRGRRAATSPSPTRSPRRRSRRGSDEGDGRQRGRRRARRRADSDDESDESRGGRRKRGRDASDSGSSGERGERGERRSRRHKRREREERGEHDGRDEPEERGTGGERCKRVKRGQGAEHWCRKPCPRGKR